MKKHYYASGICALLIAAAMPMLAFAQNVPAPEQQLPPTTPATSIRDRIRAEYQTHLQDTRNNEDYRNGILRGHLGSSTPVTNITTIDATATPRFHRNINPDIGNASTSATSTLHYEDGGKAMRINDFKARRDQITQQFDDVMTSLTNVRSLIGGRITKDEASRTDMTSAKNLLITADEKLVIAQNAIASITEMDISATTTPSDSRASSTLVIDLSKPRMVTADIINDIKDAKDALTMVVTAIKDAEVTNK